MNDMAENADGKEIINILQEIFGKHAPDVLSWYREAVSGKSKYTVFASPESYAFAFAMERADGKSMDAHTICLTQSSFLLCCDAFARKYVKTGEFPKIAVYDTSVSYGRWLSQLYYTIERRLEEILCIDMEVIQADFSKAVTTHIYAKSKNGMLIPDRYGRRLYARWQDAESARGFSAGITWLLLKSGISLNCYVPEICLTEGSAFHIISYLKESGMDITEHCFQNCKSYTAVTAISDREGKVKKAALAVQFLKAEESGRFCVFPFTFLPNMDNRATLEIIHALEEKVHNPGFSEMADRLYSIGGKQAANEFITFIFSSGYLQEVLGVSYMNTEGASGIRKIARNFTSGNLAETERMFSNILSEGCFLRKNVASILCSAIKGPFCLSMDKDGMENTDTVCSSVPESVEKYFCRKFIENDSESSMLMNPYCTGNMKHTSMARGAGFIIRDLCMGRNESVFRSCIAALLHASGTGTAEISSCPPSTVRAVGFAQFIRSGRLSMNIEILNRIQYIDLLAEAEEECSRWKVDILWEMKQFSNYVSRISDKNAGNMPDRLRKTAWELKNTGFKHIMDLINMFSETGQYAEEWRSPLLLFFAAKDMDEYKMLKDERDNCVELYMHYLKDAYIPASAK